MKHLTKGLRPVTVFAVMAIMIYNYLVAPLFGLHVPVVPDQFWMLATTVVGLGLGGHAVENSIGIVRGRADEHTSQ